MKKSILILLGLCTVLIILYNIYSNTKSTEQLVPFNLNESQLRGSYIDNAKDWSRSPIDNYGKQATKGFIRGSNIPLPLAVQKKGDKKKLKPGADLNDCAQICNRIEDCASFHFQANKNGPRCGLKKEKISRDNLITQRWAIKYIAYNKKDTISYNDMHSPYRGPGSGLSLIHI